jgi:hypothetical protein
MTYAKGTQVSVEKSRVEIEQTLRRYGTTSFASISDWDRGYEMIGFEYDGCPYRLEIPQPNFDDFQWTPNRRYMRDAQGQRQAYDQAVRQRWRAMLIYIKATLEAVESGIISLRVALLPHVLLPGGETFHEWAEPQIQVAIQDGQMPKMLPAGRNSNA